MGDLQPSICCPFAMSTILESLLYGEVLYLSLGYLCIEPCLRGCSLVNKERGAYRTQMVIYNAVMSLFSLGCFLCTVAALGYDYGLLEWLRAATDSPITELYTNTCPSSVFSNKLFYYPAYAFHFSKYVEYLDTVWLVLKGKEVSLLQKFHHFGAAYDTYFGLYFQNEGYYVFILLNSFIHTVMYAYYAATAAGFKFKAKFVITMMQITQFLVGFYIVWPYISIPCYAADPGMVFSFWFNYAYVGSVLLLFLNFFVQDNLSNKTKSGNKQLTPGAKLIKDAVKHAYD